MRTDVSLLQCELTYTRVFRACGDVWTVDRLGSNHTRRVGDSMGAVFLARIHGREDEDRPRHVLSHRNRFSLFSRGNRSPFPSFSSIPCRGTTGHSEPQVLFLVPVQCPRTVGWLWVGEKRGGTPKGDGPWGGKETHTGALRRGPLASRTVNLAAHTTWWKRCKGAHTPHLDDRSGRVHLSQTSRAKKEDAHRKPCNCAKGRPNPKTTC